MAMPKTKDIEKFQKEPPGLAVLDLGNSDLKGMVTGKPETETILHHEVVFPADRHYQRMTKRAQQRPVEYKQAEFFTKHYRTGDKVMAMVGDGVTDNARTNKRTGETKYEEGYLDVLMAAMLLRLYPDGNDNLWLALATPADAIDYLDEIKPILTGTHKVEKLDGTVVKWKVTRLVFWEEPQGGMLRFLERNEKANNAIQVVDGQRILVIDIGGKISSMTTVMIGDNLEPFVLYNESPQPFNLGIIDVLENFAIELKGLYPSKFKLFKTAGSIPEFMLQQGIRTGNIEISGELFDVNQARLNAIANILDEIESRYIDVKGGATVSHIVVTGGGGGLLIPALRMDVLNHASVHLADDIAHIQKANLRGGSTAMIEWLEEMGFIQNV